VDPLRRRSLWHLIQQLADNGAAVLLVTHNVLEAERCVDRLAIIGDGRLLAGGTPASLKSKLGAPLRLECTLEGTEPPDLPPWLTLVAVNGRRLIAHVQVSDVNATMAWATAAQDDRVLAEFALTPASLEDVYAAWIKTEGVAA
jgi:ABC-2 type transport system ATP-binding protein